MENKIEIFKNKELGELRTVLNNDGSISVNAEDTARGFGWVQTQNKNEKQYTSIRWETINNYCEEFGFPNKLGKDDFIPESLFYLLGMKANNETAKKFQMWLAKDVIPSIRKHGMYITEELLKDKEKLQSEIDKIQNEYYELEHKINDAEISNNILKAENEDLEKIKNEYSRQQHTLDKLRIKTREEVSYLPRLTLELIRIYIKENPSVVINERDERLILKARPLYKELRKLIMCNNSSNRNIYEILYTMNIYDDGTTVAVPVEYLNDDYKPMFEMYMLN